MADLRTNYFTCTLGEAALLGCTKPTQRIPEFLEEQSQRHPNIPAVGFYLPSKSNGDWDRRILTFQQLSNGTAGVAQSFKILFSDVEMSHTVALLAPSSAEFLFTWLGLIRLGHSVLLLAPQCTPNAIAQLCQQCNANVIMYDKVYDGLADEAAKEARKLGLHLEPLTAPVRNETHVLDMLEEAPEPSIYPSVYPSYPSASGPADDEVAYLHHTSGTSTGVPKPIPQTHRSALGVLPRLDGSDAATFTTTPLYHGGVADVFRAWTSNAMVWLFPSKDRPITAANVVKCLDMASQASEHYLGQSIPPVKYFSSVPYVLQIIAEDQAVIKHLQRMDIVGVGGAALPSQVGDDLVAKGVNLVSRFGSAECGFLMSSHRDYNNDKEWEFLRPRRGGNQLRFDQREAGLNELIVQPGWPHMAKTNREDGSYATADLFAPHPSLSNAWKYHSRADSQLTLATGKKFDPAPMEAALAASSVAVSEVLIFGNGRPYPGALVFRSKEAEAMNEEGVKKAITPALEKLNNESQGHASISPSMVFVMPYDRDGLEKSSKGSILRTKVEERYQDVIGKSYTDGESAGDTTIPNEDLSTAVLNIVSSIISSKASTPKPLDYETDLFAAGIDSVASVQIRQKLSRFLPEGASPLPLSVVQDAGTVNNLSELLLRLRLGQKMPAAEDPQKLMRKLVEKYSDFSDVSLPPIMGSAGIHSGETVLLTGPTGSLGAHILSLLLSDPRISHIYLLVRGATLQAASERVRKALTSRQVQLPSNFDKVTTIIPCRLQDPDLGLDPATITNLRDSITSIIHLAWDVNFTLSLPQFESVHLTGLRNLLSLALSSPHKHPPRFTFCSSTASVSLHSIPIPEFPITDPSTCSSTGYARSKWVAENILTTTVHRYPRLKDRITIIRVGQLSANTKTGVWNASEAYPLMLSTAKKTVVGCLPDLDRARRDQGERGEELNWLPVDSAAAAFVEAAFTLSVPSRKPMLQLQDHDAPDQADTVIVHEGIEVLHLLPPPRDSVKTWSSLLVAMKMAEGVNIVSIDEWLAKLEKLRDNPDPKTGNPHPACKLIDFWRTTYTVPPPEDDDGYIIDGEEVGSHGGWSSGTSLVNTQSHLSAIDMLLEKELFVSSGFEMGRSLERMPGLSLAREVDMGYVMKLWGWIRGNV